MNPILKNLRYIILESPYDSLHTKLTQQLFPKIIALKLKGYQSRGYPYGVMPMDATDYIATHLVVCHEDVQSGEFTPLFAQRSLSLKRCEMHHFEFPLITIARANHAPMHEKVVREIVDVCTKENMTVTYESSMTIDPSITDQPELMEIVRGLLLVGPYLYHQSIGTQEMLAMAALKYKADRYFSRWGFKPLANEGKELPTLVLPNYGNIEVKLYNMPNGYEPELGSYSMQFMSYWNNRIVIPGKMEVGVARGRRQKHQ